MHVYTLGSRISTFLKFVIITLHQHLLIPEAYEGQTKRKQNDLSYSYK
jgi:hypothetical protein